MIQGHSTIWIILEDSVNQARHRRINIVGLHLFEIFGKGKFLETENRLELTRA